MPVTVFLVDDVPDMRMLLRVALEADPELRVVGEAGDGAEALEGIARTQPDVVVLDLSLPGIDGLEVLSRISAVAPNADVVVFSGYTAERMEETALGRGASRYVEKGTRIEQLVAIVREVGTK
jgi:DNA-binding NarL/FixJ family response regulator